MRVDIISCVGIGIAFTTLIMTHFYNKQNLVKEKRLLRQDQFSAYRSHVKKNRKSLMLKAYEEYALEPAIEGIPVLAKKEWIMNPPILIGELMLEEEFCKTLRGSDKELLSEIARMLPPSSSSSKNILYSEAIIDSNLQPTYFSNRECYRLTGIDRMNEAGKLLLKFGICKYFDHFDVGEALSHESAMQDMKGKNKKFNNARQVLGNPFDLEKRCVVTGISTLTIRKEVGNSTFYMMKRDGSKVASGMNSYHVIPAGEFQPSSKSPVSRREDFDIWKNIMREFNEEFLGADEAFGDETFVTDYDVEPYNLINEALNRGDVKCYYLGIAMDPLNLKADILTVCVWNAESFDMIFKNMVNKNSEGEIIMGGKKRNTILGIPFEEEYIDRFIKEYDTVPNAMACLKQAWEHKTSLGIE